MIFETERLLLRPWELTDADSLYRYASSPIVGPRAGWPAHPSADYSLHTIETVLSMPNSYAVCLKRDEKAIGAIALMKPRIMHEDVQEDDWEVGYWIGVPFWGKGYIPEAVLCLMDYAFEKLNATGIWAGYYEGNHQSKRVMEKCGLTYHHTRNNVYLELLDEVRTEHFMYRKKA